MLKYCDFVEVFLRAVYAILVTGYKQTTSILLTISAKMKKFSPRHEDLSHRKTHGEVICNLITRTVDRHCCIAFETCLEWCRVSVDSVCSPSIHRDFKASLHLLGSLF